MNNREFSTSIIFYLHQLTLCLDMVGDKVLRESLDISYTQFMILMSAQKFPNSNQQQMATWLNITRSTVSQNVDSMVQKNLIQRIPSPVSRRENVIQILKKGEDILDQAYTLVMETGDILFSEMKKDSLDNLQQTLQELTGPKLTQLLRLHGYLP
jgi:DNA-binding MarR family transcriptional regulator